MFSKKQAEDFLNKYKSDTIAQKTLNGILIHDILPMYNHKINVQENFALKARCLGYMVYKLMLVHLGYCQPLSRDSYYNKRMITQGDLLFQLFENSYKAMIKQIRAQVENLATTVSRENRLLYRPDDLQKVI